ncbi:MAG: hypothetical protein ACOX3P_03595 [Saccharofermentanales bacterium]|nr:hypothetical protein [Bacillota bacterium]
MIKKKVAGRLMTVGLLALGGILLENEDNIGVLPLVRGIIWLIIGFIPFLQGSF